MTLRPSRDAFITCAVTGAGDTTGRSDRVPVTPRQIGRVDPSSGFEDFIARDLVAFIDGTAASGGYITALAADRIVARETSIVGSIGVIFAGFGLDKAIAKLGIERRVHTSGENKSVLDPFQPEKKEDIKRLLALQADVHDAFKSLVKSRRQGKLKGEESELFSGAFWSGRQALDHGLIDGIGHLHDVLRQKFGDRLVLRQITAPHGLMRRFGLGIDGGEIAASALDSLETRALWARFGL